MAKYREQYRRAQEAHQQMEQRIEESCRRTGHGRPVTRREYLLPAESFSDEDSLQALARFFYQA